MVGEWMRFTAGKGPTDLTCAQNAVYLNPALKGTGSKAVKGKKAGRFGFRSVVLLAGLLVLPTVALSRLPFELWMEVGGAAFLSGVAILVNASDKKRARACEWRISEATLHLLELAGGWPGAFLAHRALPHKCSKMSYQLIFWIIVALHELVALDLCEIGRLLGRCWRRCRLDSWNLEDHDRS